MQEFVYWCGSSKKARISVCIIVYAIGLRSLFLYFLPKPTRPIKEREKACRIYF
jgi:hypothetical protein